jgi:peptidoglycan/xylan/chitin deacetylase (PgdA/CDA1 family)
MLKKRLKEFIVQRNVLKHSRRVIRSLHGPCISIIYGHRVLPDYIINNHSSAQYLTGQISLTDMQCAIQALSTMYKFISIDDAVNQIKNNNIEEDAVVFTFDDGFHDNYTYLNPILKENKIPVTLYVNPSVIGTSRSLWFQAVNNIFFNTNKSNIYIKINNTNYDTTTQKNRCKSAFHFMRYLQANHPPVRFHEIINNISEKHSMPLDIDRHIAWEELASLSNEPYVTIGAHTMNHYPLNLCSDSLAKEEIMRSKITLESNLDIKVNHFSYPRGHRSDFSKKHIAMIKEAGFVSASSTIRGITRGSDNQFCLKRNGLPQDISLSTTNLLWYGCGY